MTPDQNELVRRLHHEVGHLPHNRLVPIAAGDVVRLVNFLRMEQRRADAAETRLRTILTRAAEENLETLLLTGPSAGEPVPVSGATSGEPSSNTMRHSAAPTGFPSPVDARGPADEMTPPQREHLLT